jgi:hypothetical protein
LLISRLDSADALTGFGSFVASLELSFGVAHNSSKRQKLYETGELTQLSD